MLSYPLFANSLLLIETEDPTWWAAKCLCIMEKDLNQYSNLAWPAQCSSKKRKNYANLNPDNVIFHPRKGTSFPATQGMPTLWLYKVLATPKTKIHINNQQLILLSKMKHFSAHSYETTHTCTGFRLNTWNASALIDKNLRNFLVSMFSSSSACFTCTRGNKYAYKEKIWE